MQKATEVPESNAVIKMLAQIKSLAEESSPGIFTALCKFLEIPADTASLAARGAVETELRDCFMTCAKIAFSDFREGLTGRTEVVAKLKKEPR
jgi:hypothetical protein